MSKSLLRQYIRTIVEATPLARVPTQLLSPDEAKESDKDKDEEIEEFGAVAGAMGGGSLGGFTAPVGTKKKKKSR